MVAEHIQHCEQTLMFTDIVGYSRLMGRDETMAVEMLGDYRKILISHIEAQSGQLVEFVGDAIFARFNTAASAVAAAIAIQQHLLAFNEARDKKLPRLQTRIGLHKGEVMLRDGAVFGDSVNIAARLEPLAVADGICISQSVYDEVRITLSSPAKRLGLQTLKNIEQKVRVFLIKPSGIGWRDHLHYFLRGLNKNIVTYRYPLTACLLALIAAGVYFIPRWLVPGYAANYVEIADFTNLMDKSGDADYFSAGITSAVRSQLADMRDVYIVDAKEGIHAPIRLEGSVQKLDDNLRISYRLFRRKGNVQIAGGKLDGKYQDIFILQDRLVGEVARYLADEFDLQNFRPAPLRLTSDVTAYDFYLKGLGFLNEPSSQGGFDDAIQYFNQALLHDSNFVLAISGLCEAYRLKYELTLHRGWLDKAEKYCSLAIERNENSADAYASIGGVYREGKKFNEAIIFFNEAIEKDGDNIKAIIGMAGTYDLMNDKAKAEQLFKEAISIDPKNWLSYQEYGYFLLRNGRSGEAIQCYEEVLKITPENIVALSNIGAAYLYLGEFEKAEKPLKKATLLEPSDIAFSNLGVAYYYLGDFEKSVLSYKAAIDLDPTNIQYLNNIVDAYFFLKKDSVSFRRYLEKVIFYSKEKISKDPSDVSGYLYLALASLNSGSLSDAKSLIEKIKVFDHSYLYYYVKLRIAIAEGNESEVVSNSKKLIDLGYSRESVVADPHFSVLRKNRFDYIF